LGGYLVWVSGLPVWWRRNLGDPLGFEM